MSDPIYEVISKAKRQAESGNADGAVKTLEVYLEKDQENVEVRLLLARTLIFDLKKVEEGTVQLYLALEYGPDNVDVMKAAVTVLMRNKKNNAKVTELFERLMTLDPDSELYNMYAKFLRVQKTDFKTAGEYYEKAIALNPRKHEYHQNYAVLLLNDLKDYEKAKVELETLMELDPGNVSAKKNYDLLMKKKFDKNGNVIKKRRLFR